MRRQGFLVSLAAAGAVCTPQASEAEEAVLRLASSPDDDVMPVLWADKAGWFKEAGIQITIQRVNNGSASMAAVAGGAIDIGKSSMFPIVLAHARDLPLSVIAAGGLSVLTTVYSGLLVRKDSNINSAPDLNNKVISVPGLNDLQAIATQAWIDKHGGNSKSVLFVEEPGSAVGIALDTNRIAAGTLANPSLSQALATGKYRNIGRPLEGIADRLMTSCWVAQTAWASKNAATVRKFGEIVARAAAYVGAHHDQTVDIIARFTGMDPAAVRSMARAVYPDKLDPALIQPLIDVATRYGAIKERFKATDLFFLGAYGISRD